MTDTVILERLGQVEHKIRGFEELAYSFADTLNTRTNRYESEFTDIRARLGLIDRAISMLQVDVRDLRSGVTAQLVLQDKTIAEMAVQVKTLDKSIAEMAVQVKTLDKSIAEMTVQVKALDKSNTEMAVQVKALDKSNTEMAVQVKALDQKLDVILAKLGA